VIEADTMKGKRLLIAIPAILLLGGCQAADDFRDRAVRRLQDAAICSLIQIPASGGQAIQAEAPAPLRLNRSRTAQADVASAEMPRRTAPPRRTNQPAAAVQAHDAPLFAPDPAPPGEPVITIRSAELEQRAETAAHRAIELARRPAPRIAVKAAAVTALPIGRQVDVEVVVHRLEVCSAPTVVRPLQRSGKSLPRPASPEAPSGGGNLCSSVDLRVCAQSAAMR
jgi:hypothetical protein